MTSRSTCRNGAASFRWPWEFGRKGPCIRFGFNTSRACTPAVLLVLALLFGIGDARAQAANQCSVANSVPLINSPADSGWVQDGADGLTHTPALNANQATTRYGTQTNGAIRLAGELQWNNATGGSGRATMTIFVNGVAYAQLSTSPNSAGQTSTAGTFTGQNGALISVNGAAESVSQVFVGDESTGRTFRPITVTLPLSVTQVTSLQYVYHANYEGAGADDDIRYRNLNVNQCKASLRLQKQIVTGRESNTDQFTLNIVRGGTTVASTTTTGNGTNVNNGLITVAPFDVGVLHTLSEAAAGTTDLDDYTTTYTCANASSGTGTVMPGGTGISFAIAPASGDDITCTLVNARKPVTLTLTKISHGGTRAFTFTGNNGWSSQTLTTTVPGVGVTGATQTLNNPLTATTITEALPPGFVLSSVACTGMGAGGAVTTGTNSFTLNAAAMDAGSEIACTVTNAVQSQPAFPSCTSDMYLSQSPDTSTNTRLYGVGTGTNPFTYPLIGQGGFVYNATGYNPEDNFLYAIRYPLATGSNHLLRVGADGSTVNLGAVTGLPNATYNSGTFSDAGVYYVKPTGNNATLYAIDVISRAATPISLSGSFTASDIGWVNGLLYAVADNGQLYSITTSGTVTAIGSPTGGSVLGAQFGFPNGLYGAANSGGFFQIDLATGVRTRISGSPSSTVNDGANCPTAPITFLADLAITKTDGATSYTPGTSVVYTIVVSNNGPFGAQNARVQDALPAGISTASWTCTAANDAACHTASGSGDIDALVDLPYNTSGPGATATFTLTMAVPAGFAGDLVNTATVTPGQGNTDPNPDNNTATDTNVQVTADLWITKTNTPASGPNDLPDDTVIAGTETIYDIVIGNNGPFPVSGAVVRDEISSGLVDCELVTPACAVVSGIATCPGVGAGAGQLSIGNLLGPGGVSIPLLEAGGSIRIGLRCTVE